MGISWSSHSERRRNVSISKNVLAVEEYLSGDRSLDDVWRQFDEDGNGTIDMSELRNLVFAMLMHFSKVRQPLRPPSKEVIETHVPMVMNQVLDYVDKNKDNKISEEEFELVGVYLRNESKNLQEYQDKSKSGTQN